MNYARFFFSLIACLIAFCGVQAHVIQPGTHPCAPDPAEVVSFSGPSTQITSLKIESPTITEWSSGRLFAGSFLLAYGGEKRAVPGLGIAWIGCQSNPVNYVDPDGRDVYAVYRKLGIQFLGDMTWPQGHMAGHVYLAFDDRNMGKYWADVVRETTYDDNGTVKTLDPYKLMTFSFHPWSVNPLGGGKGNIYSVIKTKGSWADINNFDEDIDPIQRHDVEIIRIDSDEIDQVRLFKHAMHSAKINRVDMMTADNGFYSFLINNCAGWAKRMVVETGLNWPWRANLWNMGTDVGGPLDMTKLPDMVFGLTSILFDPPKSQSDPINRMPYRMSDLYPRMY